LRRVLLVLAAFAGLVALTAWGCATTQATGAKGAPPVEATPDGGWVNFRPTRQPYEVDPVQAALGQPTMSPFGLAGTDVH
jgi:hypothetical protein